MARPSEYDNLLKIGAFKEAVSSRDSIEQFMQTAQDLLVSAKAGLPVPARFVLAYEGMFSVVMAVLEFHAVRPGDGGGHRATAIARVAADLKLTSPQQSVLTRLHDARNRVTYRNSIPAVSKADADAMEKISNDLLSSARALIGAP